MLVVLAHPYMYGEITSLLSRSKIHSPSGKGCARVTDGCVMRTFDHGAPRDGAPRTGGRR